MLTGKVTNTIESVKNSPASIFTKEDVIKLIESMNTDEANEDEDIQNEASTTITESEYREMLDDIQMALNSIENEYGSMDIQDAAFSLNGNTIEVDSVSVDMDLDVIYDEIETIVDRYIKF